MCVCVPVRVFKRERAQTQESCRHERLVRVRVSVRVCTCVCVCVCIYMCVCVRERVVVTIEECDVVHCC